MFRFYIHFELPLYMMQGEGLNSFFCMWISGCLSSVCWKRVLFPILSIVKLGRRLQSLMIKYDGSCRFFTAAFISLRQFLSDLSLRFFLFLICRTKEIEGWLQSYMWIFNCVGFDAPILSLVQRSTILYIIVTWFQKSKLCKKTVRNVHSTLMFLPKLVGNKLWISFYLSCLGVIGVLYSVLAFMVYKFSAVIFSCVVFALFSLEERTLNSVC